MPYYDSDIRDQWREDKNLDPYEPPEMHFDEDAMREAALKALRPPRQEGQRLKQPDIIRLGKMLKRRALSPRQQALQKLQQRFTPAATTPGGIQR